MEHNFNKLHFSLPQTFTSKFADDRWPERDLSKFSHDDFSWGTLAVLSSSLIVFQPFKIKSNARKTVKTLFTSCLNKRVWFKHFDDVVETEFLLRKEGVTWPKYETLIGCAFLNKGLFTLMNFYGKGTLSIPTKK